MKTLEIRLYEFNELNQDAKENAINEYRRKMGNWGPDLDCFKYDCEEKAEQIGFKDIKLAYSLGNCQGDGVSFKCSYIDTAKFIAELWPNCKTSVIDTLCNNISFDCIGNTNRRYCYASNGDIQMYLYFYKNFHRSLPNLEAMAYKLHEYIQDQYLSLCNKFEKIGYQEIEYFYSDENIIQTIEANEIEFTENGKQF